MKLTDSTRREIAPPLVERRQKLLERLANGGSSRESDLLVKGAIAEIDRILAVPDEPPNPAAIKGSIY